MSKLLRKVFSVGLCAALVGGTAVTLPAVVQESGIAVSAATTTYTTEDGRFKYQVANNLVTITSYLGNESVVSIPSEIDGNRVDKIYKKAFYQMTFVNKVILPDTITSIGESSFSGCTGLTEINFPDSLTVIEKNAFRDCTGLNEVSIPDSVSKIENGAFYQCKGISTVDLGDGVTTIDDYAFYRCSGINTVTNGSKVSTIGKDAFWGCAGIKKFDILTEGSASDLKILGVLSFSECTGLENVILPEGFTTISRSAFFRCSGLKEVVYPSTLSTIEKSAFSGCLKLSKIIMSDNVTEIGSFAFQNCKIVKSIYIPDSVVSIGDDAFENVNVTFYGSKGSYAEQYAERYSNISFVAVEELQNTSEVPQTDVVIGEKVYIKGAATGGTGSYTIKFDYKRHSKTTWVEKIVNIESPKTSYRVSFTPKYNTYYDVRVTVTDSSGRTKVKTFSVVSRKPLENKSTISTETGKVGEKIVLKGAASGGSKGYKYAFYYKKSKNSEWIEMKPAYTTKSAAFKPGSATSYDVKSIVMDADGRTAEKIYTVKVTK